MAIIVNRSGVWYARFRHAGKEYFRSTGIKVPAKGVKKLQDSRADAEAELYRMQVELKGGESVDALFARLVEAIALLPEKEREPRRITLSDRLRQGTTAQMAITAAWEAWLNHPGRGEAGPATVMMYHAYWGALPPKKRTPDKPKPRGFLGWLATHHPAVNALHEISPRIAEEYASHLKSLCLAPRTYNGAIKFLRSMFNTLKSRAGLVTNVWDVIPSLKNETESRRNLSPEELEKICATASGDLRYLIAIGLYTGLRLGDAATLKWNGGTHVDKAGRQHKLGVLLNKQVIRLLPQKTRRKQKLLTIPIHPVLHAILQVLRSETDGDSYLLPQFAAFHIRGRAEWITKQIQGHFKACGIETTEHVTDGSRKRAIVRVGFHSLRHSFVSLCAANKVPQHAIQELVGHGSPAMTMLYSHADDQQKIEAISVLPEMAFDTKLIEAEATVKSEPTPKRSGKARSKAKSTKQRPVRHKK